MNRAASNRATERFRSKYQIKPMTISRPPERYRTGRVAARPYKGAALKSSLRTNYSYDKPHPQAGRYYQGKSGSTYVTRSGMGLNFMRSSRPSLTNVLGRGYMRYTTPQQRAEVRSSIRSNFRSYTPSKRPVYSGRSASGSIKFSDRPFGGSTTYSSRPTSSRSSTSST